jgi:hypothetical protein
MFFPKKFLCGILDFLLIIDKIWVLNVFGAPAITKPYSGRKLVRVDLT